MRCSTHGGSSGATAGGARSVTRPARTRRSTVPTPRASGTSSTCASTTRRRTRTRTSPRRSRSGSRPARSGGAGRLGGGGCPEEARVGGRAQARAARHRAARALAAARRAALAGQAHAARALRGQAGAPRERPTHDPRPRAAEALRRRARPPRRAGDGVHPPPPGRAAAHGRALHGRVAVHARARARGRVVPLPRARAARGPRRPPAARRLRAPPHRAHRALPLLPPELGGAVKNPLRILVLMHPSLVPPDTLKGQPPEEVHRWKTEFGVVSTLRKIGHEVRALGVQDELNPIRVAAEEWKPDVVFNLLEEFYGLSDFDSHVVSYLELLKLPYTGCNPRGLV